MYTYASWFTRKWIRTYSFTAYAGFSTQISTCRPSGAGGSTMIPLGTTCPKRAVPIASNDKATIHLRIYFLLSI